MPATRNYTLAGVRFCGLGAESSVLRVDSFTERSRRQLCRTLRLAQTKARKQRTSRSTNNTNNKGLRQQDFARINGIVGFLMRSCDKCSSSGGTPFCAHLCRRRRRCIAMQRMDLMMDVDQFRHSKEALISTGGYISVCLDNPCVDRIQHPGLMSQLWSCLIISWVRDRYASHYHPFSIG